jgi:hypothetical protein
VRWDRQELWCIFDGSAGTGTVPVAALQTLKADASLDSALCIGHYNRRCYGVGGYHLQATATNGVWWEATVK